MEWVKIENRRDGELNHYYVVGENDLLTFKGIEKITCKLPHGTIKNLSLDYKLFDVVRYENGIPFHIQTKKWFVKDGEKEYLIDEIEVSKKDIAVYRQE